MTAENAVAPVLADRGDEERGALGLCRNRTTTEVTPMERDEQFATEACKRALRKRDYSAARAWMRVLATLHRARSPEQVAHLEALRGLR